MCVDGGGVRGGGAGTGRVYGAGESVRAGGGHPGLQSADEHGEAGEGGVGATAVKLPEGGLLNQVAIRDLLAL